MNLALLREYTYYELERSRTNRERQIKTLTKEIKLISKLMAEKKHAALSDQNGPAAAGSAKQKGIL